ncbi:MAG: glycerol kinase GlpK [Dehalococcoidia bacterium]|nr:glycerol kinase GlpK [Dehalococcoidia bacterium]
MQGPFVLAIDQGTTSSRAVVVGRDGAVVGAGQHAFPQLYPRPGWVEHDPEAIWRSVEAAIADALGAEGLGVGDVAAIGITNQRETVVLWERATGEPVANAIVWQDRRTADLCDELRAAGHERAVQHATGLTIDPYFSGTKLAWLLREQPELRTRAEAGELAAGTVDSWLAWKLSGGARHVTDYTNASRTMLFNIRRGRWDGAMLELLGVPRAVLPAPAPARSPFAVTSGAVLGAEVPILAIAGDQQASLFGQACFRRGQAKNTYGTGCFLLSNSGATAVDSENRLLTSIGAGAGPRRPEYVLEGSVFVAGALVQWLRDGLGIIRSSDEIEELAATVPDAGGVVVVPALTGLGAPHWDPRARGAILGLTRGTDRAHIARAALEAIALSSAELALAMMRDLGEPLTELRVDGGACRNDLLMQLQADFLGIPVTRPKNTETTAMGAAYLAGLEAGVWSSPDEVAELWEPERTFEPAMSDDARLAKLHEWSRAVYRSLDWATS